MYIDSHCHLDFPEFDSDRLLVIRRAEVAGIASIINIGSSLEGSRRSVALTKEFFCVYASVGIHPHEADHVDEAMLGKIAALAQEEKVVAIGETGLDYFKHYSEGTNQRKLFLQLINLAKERELPLVIHSRQAQADTLMALKSAMPIRAVVHCFSGDEDFLKCALEMGFFVSFTCNITYTKAENLRRLVSLAPLERIFLETDAPFLAPQVLRGRRNEPQNVVILAEEIAKLKGTTKEEVGRITSQTAKKFFNIP